MPPRLAVYLSNHGYGHCVRSATLLEKLADIRPFTAEVVSPLPDSLWPARLRPLSTWRREICDAGVVQSDDISVDVSASEAALAQWQQGYERALDREVSRLRGKVDLVVGDVPPLAFDAAAAAGVAAVAVANFSWDWIYGELGLAEAARSAEAAYRKAGLLLELEPAAPMRAFSKRRAVGVLGRSPSRDRHFIRAGLGVKLEQRLVLLSFRVSGRGSVFALPDPAPDLIYMIPPAAAADLHRTDIIVAPQEGSYADLVAAADAVVSKPGYGILGDVVGCGSPLLMVAREGFPEDRVLVRWLLGNHATAVVETRLLAAGRWLDTLGGLLSQERPEPAAVPAASAAAAAIAELLA